MSVNKAILVGRLGRDPETRYTSGGQAVCNFTMATDESFKDRAGERCSAPNGTGLCGRNKLKLPRNI